MVKPLELEDWESKVGLLAQSWLLRDAPAPDCIIEPRDLLSDQDSFAAINRIIESEIIPRLLLTHSGPSLRDALARMAKPEGFVAGEEEVAELTRLLLTQDVAVASAYVETIRSQGVTLGSLYLSLFAPTAQLVGDWWRDDRCGFTDVLLVLSRLQQLLRDFTPTEESRTTH